MILPIPNDSPPEIPRVILKDASKSYSVNVALDRTDIQFHSEEDKATLTPLSKIENAENILFPLLSDTYEILTACFGAKMTRIALIAKEIVKLQESSKVFLNRVYFKKDTNPFEMNLAFLYKEKINEFQVNRWLRLNTLRKKSNQNDDKAISIISDINTVVESQYKFNVSNVKQYAVSSIKTIGTITKEILQSPNGKTK